VPPGIRVVEVDRSGRQDRRRQGKSDPLDAVSTARAAQSGRHPDGPGRHRRGDPGADGSPSAAPRGERTQTINQARAPVLTGPDELRARFTRHTRLRWWPGWRRCGPAAAMPGLRHPHRAARAALPEAHEGTGSLRRPKASGQPR
jgi:transposase